MGKTFATWGGDTLPPLFSQETKPMVCDEEEEGVVTFRDSETGAIRMVMALETYLQLTKLQDTHYGS